MYYDITEREREGGGEREMLLFFLDFTTLFNILGHQHRFRHEARKVRQILLSGSNFGLRFFYVP